MVQIRPFGKWPCRKVNTGDSGSEIRSIRYGWNPVNLGRLNLYLMNCILKERVRALIII